MPMQQTSQIPLEKMLRRLQLLHCFRAKRIIKMIFTMKQEILHNFFFNNISSLLSFNSVFCSYFSNYFDIFVYVPLVFRFTIPYNFIMVLLEVSLSRIHNRNQKPTDLKLEFYRTLFISLVFFLIFCFFL